MGPGPMGRGGMPPRGGRGGPMGMPRGGRGGMGAPRGKLSSVAKFLHNWVMWLDWTLCYSLIILIQTLKS